jgi:hypothetical protein
MFPLRKSLVKDIINYDIVTRRGYTQQERRVLVRMFGFIGILATTSLNHT